MMKRAWLLICGLLALPAPAQELEVQIEIPRLKVAEYHRPYVAVWLEGEGIEPVNLAVWYDTQLADREGEKWLKDMRQWWRRSGRTLSLPVDGVTGATRAPGRHGLQFAGDAEPLAALATGDYQLRVEAAREVGGRELITIPFAWPPREAQQLEADGERELGRVELQLRPGS